MLLTDPATGSNSCQTKCIAFVLFMECTSKFNTQIFSRYLLTVHTNPFLRKLITDNYKTPRPTVELHCTRAYYFSQNLGSHFHFLARVTTTITFNWIVKKKQLNKK